MMILINTAIPIIGMIIIFYVMLTNRIDTKCRTFGVFFSLSIVLWLLLFWADWTIDFVPVWQTVAARMVILLMVLTVIKKAWLIQKDNEVDYE
jgi:hypothetical protein